MPLWAEERDRLKECRSEGQSHIIAVAPAVAANGRRFELLAGETLCVSSVLFFVVPSTVPVRFCDKTGEVPVYALVLA